MGSESEFDNEKNDDFNSDSDLSSTHEETKNEGGNTKKEKVTLKSFICDTCGRVVKGSKDYKRHVETHKDLKDRKTFACEKCGKCLVDKRSFFTHKVRVCKIPVDDEEFKKYYKRFKECEHCHKKFRIGKDYTR